MANCKTCGKDLSLVGRVHNCVPVFEPLVTHEEAVGAVQEFMETVKPEDTPFGESGNRVDGSTYKYRDKESRREYMKEYMRKRREDHQH